MEDRIETVEQGFYEYIQSLDLNRVGVPLLSEQEVIRLIRIQRYIDMLLKSYIDKGGI
jgi:CRISPR/Cas system-associated protein Cas7 (RAMP superfamily)